MIEVFQLNDDNFSSFLLGTWSWTCDINGRCHCQQTENERAGRQSTLPLNKYPGTQFLLSFNLKYVFSAWCKITTKKLA